MVLTHFSSTVNTTNFSSSSNDNKLIANTNKMTNIRQFLPNGKSSTFPLRAKWVQIINSSMRVTDTVYVAKYHIPSYCSAFKKEKKNKLSFQDSYKEHCRFFFFLSPLDSIWKIIYCKFLISQRETNFF